MAHHKKLTDEALVNDYVIHQNAFADRKLQKQLDQLEKMQTMELKRFEKEEHYFTVLHKVVPAFHPGDESSTQTTALKQRPNFKKRHTSQAIAAKSHMSEETSFQTKSGSTRRATSPRIQTEVLNLKGIARDVPDSYAASVECKHKRNNSGLCRKSAGICDVHVRSVMAGDCRTEKKNCHSPKLDLEVTGSRLGERKSHASQQFLRLGGDISARTKCMQFINENGSYLHDVDSLALQSHENDDGEKNDGSIASNKSDVSEISLSDEEKLPNIGNVGLRLMGYNPSTQKMKMLYQLREGQLDLPQDDFSSSVLRTSAAEGELLTLKQLRFDHRRLRHSSDLELKREHAPLEAMHSDPQLVNVAQMTLVKFLPKCKQALYLKDICNLSRDFRKSWHAGDKI